MANAGTIIGIVSLPFTGLSILAFLLVGIIVLSRALSGQLGEEEPGGGLVVFSFGVVAMVCSAITIASFRHGRAQKKNTWIRVG